MMFLTASQLLPTSRRLVGGVLDFFLQEFDKKYGGGWQCVVGSNFGCFFTHTKGTFVYFALGTLNFLIFKGASS
ncbi:hypothetical protein REPUB_Repub18cG0093900 [Reevesia pubescens]